MSFGVPVRNGLGIGLKASTSLSTRGGTSAPLPPDVTTIFSTSIYTGNGALQTITNGINLSGQGGLVWAKLRSGSSTYWHSLCDTIRGAGNMLATNETIEQFSQPLNISGFTSTGFTMGGSFSNTAGFTFASWTFREAPNFFDIVTYTGNGANRNIAHNLGVAPGMILVKRTDIAADWQVYHRSNANTQYQVLNSTAAVATGATRWNSTTPTSTEFTVGTDTTVNASGGTYVAYLYAHVSTSDGVIQCGSYTGNGSATGPVINLGWQPQWLMIKNASGTGDWQIIDSVRGMPVGAPDATLQANLTSAETSVDYVSPSSTGFQVTSTSSQVNTNLNAYIYVAIRSAS